jgi:glycosyltransferase involved in cell wall biosynthesis
MGHPGAAAPRVVVAGVYLDPLGRHPDALLTGGWRGFGRSAAAARRAGADVCIVQASWYDADREIEGVPCHFIRERGHPLFRFPGGRTVTRRARRLLARVAALSPDLIHFEGLLLPRAVRALARAVPGVPILAQDHGTKCPTGWRRRWLRWGFAPLAGVAFTARPQAQPFVSAGILRPDLPVFEVIETSTAFTPADQRLAQSTADLDGDPCLVWAGNLDPNKDPFTVLDAVSQVATALPALRLHMCFRQAPLLEAVRARIAADPFLMGRVRLAGEVPHAAIEAWFRAADFVVQASHREGSGVAIIEALACGVTPLVTDIPSFRRITGDGQFGALVPIGDSRSFAAAIRDWSARDRHVLRERARAHFVRELSFDAIGRQLRAAYDALRQSR